MSGQLFKSVWIGKQLYGCQVNCSNPSQWVKDSMDVSSIVQICLDWETTLWMPGQLFNCCDGKRIPWMPSQQASVLMTALQQLHSLRQNGRQQKLGWRWCYDTSFVVYLHYSIIIIMICRARQPRWACSSAICILETSRNICHLYSWLSHTTDCLQGIQHFLPTNLCG